MATFRCAGAFGWSRKRLLGEAMAAQKLSWYVIFLLPICVKVSRRRDPILKRSLAWTCSDLLFSGYIWCALSTKHPEETHINYIIEGNSIPIIPLLLADVVCEPVRRQKTEGYLVSAATLSCAWKVERLHHGPELCSRSRRRKRVAFGRTEYATHVASCSAQWGGRDRGGSRDQRQPSHNLIRFRLGACGTTPSYGADGPSWRLFPGLAAPLLHLAPKF